MYTCNTDQFKQLVKGEKYQAEEEKTQELCGKKKELIAIRVNGKLQRFQKTDFISENK